MLASSSAGSLNATPHEPCMTSAMHTRSSPLFGTRHELGLEKMKDAIWKADLSYGIRYRHPRSTQIQMLDPVLEPDTAPLRRILREYIAHASDGRIIPELTHRRRPPGRGTSDVRRTS